MGKGALMEKGASGLGSFLVLLASRHMATDFIPPRLHAATWDPRADRGHLLESCGLVSHTAVGPLVPWRAWHGPPWRPPEPAPPSPQSVGTSLEDPEWQPVAARLSYAQLCFCPQGDFRAAHRTSTAMKCELLASRLKPRNQTGVEGSRGEADWVPEGSPLPP